MKGQILHSLSYRTDNGVSIKEADWQNIVVGSHYWVQDTQIIYWLRLLRVVSSGDKPTAELHYTPLDVISSQPWVAHTYGINPEESVCGKEMFHDVLATKWMPAPVIGEDNKIPAANHETSFPRFLNTPRWQSPLNIYSVAHQTRT
jgi:hypothetical protein